MSARGPRSIEAPVGHHRFPRHGVSVSLRRRATTLASLALLLLTAAEAPPPAGEVQEVPPEQAMAVLGQDIVDAQGKVMGRLVDVLISADGHPEAAVIDFGGFMGVGARKIAVHWNTLHFAPGDKKRAITLDLTQDQIKAAPEYKDVAKAAPVVVPPAPQPVSVAQPEPPPPSAQPAPIPPPAPAPSTTAPQ
jgi:hypothetical protein